jgi:crotonobetainyl-CoA:carnitine CoA-transferase CaiB-like acyl-CoA transferase
MGLAVAAAATPAEIRARPWMRVMHPSEVAPPTTDASRAARVLDLSSLWAGPLAGSLLAMAGFEVRKVESADRPDGARRGPRAFFDLLNGGKLGCALDLGEARDRGLFETLLEQADVVLESARPRALEQLGYDAEGWVRARPGRIWASITGYGREAPRRDWIAFGDDAAAAAGLAWPLPATRSPAEGHPPLPCFCADAIADPIAGLHAAVAILGHWRAGRGGLLDLSLVDVSAQAVALASEHDGLPVERGADGGWCVVADGRRVAIAAPRARRSRRSAPPLQHPNAQPGTLWSGRC